MINKPDSLVEAVNYEPSLSFVVYHNKQNTVYSKHWHSAVEIVMPIRNSYSVTVNDEAYRLNEYDILIIPSGDLHELNAVTDIGERIILQFDLSIFKATEDYLNSSYIFLKPCLITQETNTELHAELKAILLAIHEENVKKENCYEAGIIIKILDFAVRMAKKQKFEVAQDPEFFVRKREHITAFNKCIDYISQHYRENLTLDHISSIAGFSKYYFWRWFQQYSSMTFKAYLDQIRIKAAEGLLMDLNIPITDVALESGFQSIATFNRVFKSMNKCTPTEYREYNRVSGKAENPGKSNLTAFEETAETDNKFTGENGIISIVPVSPVDTAFPPAYGGVPESDLPEPDVIRVGDTYYMVCMVSGFLPGCPVMKSYDLQNWETVSYVYDILDSSGEEQSAFGIGYHAGVFYVSFACAAAGKTYVFTTDNIEANEWKRHEINELLPNPSLIFDSGKTYIVYGVNSVCVAELLPDMEGIINAETIIENAGLVYGIRAYSIRGYFYIFYVNRLRKNAVCCRSERIYGEYDIKIFPESGVLGSEPVSVTDSPDGLWYALISSADGNVGKAPEVYSVAWENGFPIVVFGQKALLPPQRELNGFIHSDEFYQNERVCYSVNNPVIHKELASKAGYTSDIKKLSIEILENTGFENGLNSWSSYGGANISIKNSDRVKDNYMLYVSGRRSTSSGPMQVVTGKVGGGDKFKVSAAVKYTTGPKSHIFNISIMIRKNVQVMASASAEKGEWCTIEGTYTVPGNADACEACILIESHWSDNPAKDDLMNFYVNNVSMVKKLSPGLRTVIEGEYDYNGSNLGAQWQWYRNPNNNCWSLLERGSFLRLSSSNICNSLPESVNILTQRTFGPVCAAETALEMQGMNSGDVAGLAALHKNYAFIAVKIRNNQKFIIVSDCGKNGERNAAELPPGKNRVYFRLDFDFSETGKMFFYYSINHIDWHAAGEFELANEEASGYRFALFNFAEEFYGGYADFDFFRVGRTLLTASKTPVVLDARIVAPAEVSGVPNTEFELIIEAHAPKNQPVGDIYGSFYIPEILDVSDVVFDAENVGGSCAYTFINNRLEFKITGDTFLINKNSNALAVIKLRVRKYVPCDTVISIKPDYIYVTGCNAAYKLNRTECAIKLNFKDLKSPAKLPGCSNPLIDHKYGADPFALVYGGRVYIYLTSDAPEYDENGKITTNTYSKITSITVISSADLVNWTDHGEIPVAGSTGIAKWANHSWAPSAACKNIDGKDKFFLYFANDASNIGVLTADSPIGPWSDPLGTSLINRTIEGVEGVTWCFDPAVLVDDDGSAYLYFGGGLPSESEQDVLHPNTARVIKLGGDMISVEGEAVLIDAPALFEDSGIHKYNGKYYYSYCSNFAGTHPEGYPPHGEIAYMVSDNPMSGFKYVGPILKNPEHFFGVGGNNHHAIFEFKGKWYITYHAQTLGKAIGDAKGYRSPHINEIEFYSGGNIKEVAADMTGVSPVEPFNPYDETDAVTFAWSGGVTVSSSQGKLVLSEIRNDDWLAIAACDFGENGATGFSANIKSPDGGVIEIHLDSLDGEIIGILRANAKEKSWSVKSCEIKKVTGVHDIFIVFKGSAGTLFSMDYWKFSV